MTNERIGAEVELSDQQLEDVAGGRISNRMGRTRLSPGDIHDGTSNTLLGLRDITDGTSKTVLVGEFRWSRFFGR